MKKIISLFSAAMLAFGLLAGCGTSPASTSVDRNAPASSSSGTTAEDITLTVFAGTAPMKEATDQIVADYEKETGIRVEWEIPGDEPDTLLKTRFASNEAPDIFDLGNDDYPTWYVRCADLTSSSWVEHVDETALQGPTVEGSIWGFPYAVEGNGIVYNKALFE